MYKINDPILTAASLTDNGRKVNSGVFITPEKAIIVAKAAFAITYRKPTVTINALSSYGQELLSKHFSTTDPVYTIDVAASAAKDLLSLDEQLRQKSIFDILRKILSILPEGSGLLGAFAFEMIDSFEQCSEIKSSADDFPDFYFLVPEEFVTIDLKLQQTSESLAESQDQTEFNYQPQTYCSVSDKHFHKLVKDCKQHIACGDIFQIVLSRTFHTPCSDPFQAFRQLKRDNVTPYLYYLNFQDHIILGASPETCVKITQHNDKRFISLFPIAGTRARGKDQQQDARQEVSLKTSPKELAEHMMLVDLARNDISRISVAGTCRVKQLADVRYFSKVMHLCSEVTGELLADLDGLHAYQACLNMGTVSGAPKIKATALIRAFEQDRRGPYGGSIGWIAASGELDLALTIRTAVVQNGIASVRTGAGIVADSDPVLEAQETYHKAKAILLALQQSQQRCDHVS